MRCGLAGVMQGTVISHRFRAQHTVTACGALVTKLRWNQWERHQRSSVLEHRKRGMTADVRWVFLREARNVDRKAKHTVFLLEMGLDVFDSCPDLASAADEDLEDRMIEVANRLQ